MLRNQSSNYGKAIGGSNMGYENAQETPCPIDSYNILVAQEPLVVRPEASKVVNSNQSAALSLRAIAERGLGASFWRRARPSVGGAAMVPAHVHR